MVKLYFFIGLLLLFFTNTIFSQNDNPDVQDFVIKNLKIESYNKYSELQGVTIYFDLDLLNPLNNYFDNPYYIYFNLKKDSNIVYASDYNVEVSAKKTYNKKISQHKDLYFFIPYSKIKTSDGKQNLLLEIYAKNNTKEFPVFFKKLITVNIPKMYYYNNQEFNISNFRAVSNIKHQNVYGVKVNFNYKVKFLSSQIKGADTDENLRKYIFYIKLINLADNSDIYFFKQKYAENEVSFIKNTDKQEFFIPSNVINLPKGEYKIAVNLYAKTYDQKYIFKILATDTITLKQPELYFFNFKLINCDIAKKEYDVPSVIGQIFSSSTSNTGLGYPDVYWTISTGDIPKFFSKTNKNELWAIPDKANIIIAENDPLSFSVFDYDITSFDDLIGEIKLKNIPGNFSKKYNSVSFDNVNSANFEYTKTKFPSLKKSNIITKPYKLNGVSGLLCEISYSFSDLPVNSNIDVTPFIKFKDKLYKVDYINVNKNTQNINNQKQKSNVKVFIPYVKIPNNSSVGFIIKDTKSEFFNKKVFENKNIIKPDINNIIAKIDNIIEKFNPQTKTFGAMVYIKWNLPEFYKFNVKNIHSHLKFYADNKIFIDTLINNIESLKNNKLSIFIPYYKLKNYSLQKINFNVKEQNFVRKYKVGESNINFSITPNKIRNLKPKKILIKFKSINNLNNITIKIYHDKKQVYTSTKQKVAKKIIFNKFNGNIICSKNDKITISVTSADKFDIEKEIFLKEYFIDKLFTRKRLNLKGDKTTIKKIKIYL